MISSGSFPSPSTTGTLPPHQSSEAIHELSSPTPHQPSVALLTTNNHFETEEEIPGPFAPRFQVALIMTIFHDSLTIFLCYLVFQDLEMLQGGRPMIRSGKTMIYMIYMNIIYMSHLLLLGKFEYGGGPIFKVVLEC